MASWWIFWPLVLSGFLLSVDCKSTQEDASTKNVGTPANMNDWKLKAAAEGSNGSFSKLLPQDPEKEEAKMSPALPTASGHSKSLQEETNSSSTKMITKVASKDPPKLLPQPEPSKVTVTWPWLVDVTSKPSQEPLSTVMLEEDSETPGSTLHSPSKKATPSLAFQGNLSTASSRSLIEGPGISAATQNHIPPSKIKLPPITAASTTPQHLDEIASTSPALVDDLEFSTASRKHDVGSGKPGLNPRSKQLLATPEPHTTQRWPDEVVSASSAFSTRSPGGRLTTSRSSATTQGKPPPANDASPLIGKCLLAILLLALVAAVFIVCSGVLAILLCRQKRAYGLGQANHTEMVCISSLLSAEKEEEEEEEKRRRRQPKVKRVHLLGDTASETEADNLTLNSFLPEH